MSAALAGRTCVVTGASAGIGLEIASGLARLGATVAVVGRHADRAMAVRSRIIAAGGAAEVFVADFAAQGDVRRLAGQIAARFPVVDVLVNNAGLVSARHVLTPEGIETTFAVNHLAPFLLTNLLLDRLRAAPNARVVTVASGAHKRGRIDFDDLSRQRGYSAWRAYAQSKLANILFTHTLAQRLAGTSVTATCCHPGVIATRIWQVNAMLRLVAPLLDRFLETPTQGADTPLWLATAPGMQGKSGGYYVRRALAPTSAAAQNDAAAERLWQVSAGMCGLTQN